MISTNLLSTSLELHFGVDGAPNLILERKAANLIEPTKLVIGAYNGAVTGVCVYGWTVRKTGDRGAMRPVSWNRFDLERMPDWLRNIVTAEASRAGLTFGGAA